MISYATTFFSQPHTKKKYIYTDMYGVAATISYATTLY